MDFTNLIIAPLAALVTIVVVLASVLIRPQSEDRALLPAFGASILAIVLITAPWRYLNWTAFFENMEAVLIFGTIGFAFGALLALIFVKGLRLARRCFSRVN